MFKKLLLAAGLFGALSAAANVVIIGTRVIIIFNWFSPPSGSLRSPTSPSGKKK